MNSTSSIFGAWGKAGRTRRLSSKTPFAVILLLGFVASWCAVAGEGREAPAVGVEYNRYFETTVADEAAYTQLLRVLLAEHTRLPTVSVLRFWEDKANPSTHLTVIHFAQPQDMALFDVRSGDAATPESQLLAVIGAEQANVRGTTSVLRSLYSASWYAGQRMRVHAFTLPDGSADTYIAAFDAAETAFSALGDVPQLMRLMSTGKRSPTVTHYTLMMDENPSALEPLVEKRIDSDAGRRFNQVVEEILTTRLYRDLTVLAVIH